jgi:Arc/MetJ family transcription regulator
MSCNPDGTCGGVQALDNWAGAQSGDEPSPSPYCREYISGCMMIHMKTMIDLDEEALALAAKELGTTTKKDTVNAALEFVAGRRRRIEQLLDDPYAFGVGPDITDSEVMRTARR